ncbi:MAG: DegT/DnrJ/EryC1/StrS family aminotransferase [Bacteroidota bacterium]
MIPFLDLHSVNSRFHEQFETAFREVLDSGYFILSDKVEAFEKQFASFCGVRHCIGVGNGLDALRLILEGYKALGRLQEGQEVLVASNTFIATILAIKQAGMKPVLVETQFEGFNFKLEALESAISENTAAIMPVHLYGQLANMASINQLAAKHSLLVIEDAAQAHGAKDESGHRAGSLAEAAGFSFYPAKNLGALGDAGAITTNDDDLAKMVRKLRNYGGSQKYVSDEVGINSRLDVLQAVFLGIKLGALDEDNDARRKIAARYLSEIKNKKVVLPMYNGSEDHVFHLFVVRVADRSHFRAYLEAEGVGSLIHYPIAPHEQKAFPEFADISFPVAERLHREVVSLPISPVMTPEQVETVISVVNRY